MMNEHGSNHESYKEIERRLISRIGEYSVLEFGIDSRLMLPTNVLTRAGIISELEGDQFDPDLAVETVRAHAFDPALN